MEKVHIFGVMVEVMKENISKIENMDLVYINGQMDVYMKDIGILGNRMAMENIHFEMVHIK